jgi:hypothetical protein
MEAPDGGATTTSEEADALPPLGNHILEKFKLKDKDLLPQNVWKQLTRLSRPPKPDIRNLKTSGSTSDEPYRNTLLGCELDMCSITVDHFDKLDSFLFDEVSAGISLLNRETLKEDMLSLILMSDIGKAGGEYAPPGVDDPVIAKIYIDWFLDGRHRDWIHNNRDSALAVMSESDIALPINFLKAPINLVADAAFAVSLENRGELSEEYIRQQFSLTNLERTQLTDYGYPPDTTPMGIFFTKSHISEGEVFLNSKDAGLSERQKKLGTLALCHHLSQGIVPKEFASVDLSDKTVLKVIAYTEILDKLDGFVGRSSDTPDIAFQKTQKLIRDGLARNKGIIPNCPEDIDNIYEIVFDFFKKDILPEMEKKYSV